MMHANNTANVKSRVQNSNRPTSSQALVKGEKKSKDIQQSADFGKSQNQNIMSQGSQSKFI